MPAGYTHYIFGEKVLEKLSPKYKNIILNNIDLYHIGLDGPDILFYYDALKSNDVIKTGQRMHREEAYKFFSNAKEVYKQAKNKDAALAYIYGFINHFVLDYVCHGYIIHMETKHNMSHYEIESELDRKCLVLNGLNPTKTCLVSHINPTKYVSEVIAPFFNFDTKTIHKGLKDLVFYLELLRAHSKIKRFIIHSIMKYAGVYEKLSPLMISYEPNPKSANDIDVLINILNENVSLSIKLIEVFLDEDLDDIYHNDFLGVKFEEQ